MIFLKPCSVAKELDNPYVCDLMLFFCLEDAKSKNTNPKHLSPKQE
jgi:hypothetical protein